MMAIAPRLVAALEVAVRCLAPAATGPSVLISTEGALAAVEKWLSTRSVVPPGGVQLSPSPDAPNAVISHVAEPVVVIEGVVCVVVAVVPSATAFSIWIGVV